MTVFVALAEHRGTRPTSDGIEGTSSAAQAGGSSCLTTLNKADNEPVLAAKFYIVVPDVLEQISSLLLQHMLQFMIMIKVIQIYLVISSRKV